MVNKWWEIKRSIGHNLHVLLLHSNTCAPSLLCLLPSSSFLKFASFTFRFSYQTPTQIHSDNGNIPNIPSLPFSLSLNLLDDTHYAYVSKLSDRWLYNVHFLWQSLSAKSLSSTTDSISSTSSHHHRLSSAS